MAVLRNLARVYTATVGAGAVTLGAAVQGYKSFVQAGCVHGEVLTYGIHDFNAAGQLIASEVGRGTYNAVFGTLARTTVLASTNADAPLNLTGNAQVFITAIAEDFDHTSGSILNVGTNTHSQIDSHIGSTSNPHNVTKAQLGIDTPTAQNDFLVGEQVLGIWQWVKKTVSEARTALGLVSGGAGDIWVEKAGDTMLGTLETPSLTGVGATPAILGLGLKSPYTRTVVVDQGGKGDYTTIKAACDYVATQSPDATNSWMVVVLSGTYSEDQFTIPTYTSVVSLALFPKFQVGRPSILFDDLSGNCITLASIGSLIAGFNIQDSAGTANGNYALLYTNGQGSVSYCSIISVRKAGTFRSAMMESGTSGNYGMTGCSLFLSAAPDAGNYGIYNLGSAVIYDTTISPVSAGGVGVYVSGAGKTVRLNNCIVQRDNAVGWTTDLSQASSATLRIINTTYKSESGTITNAGKYRTTTNGEIQASAATDIPSTTKGATSQSADLVQRKDSADTLLNGVDATGNRFNQDNIRDYFGTGKDVEVYYDGTNFIINPKKVGSGYVNIKGVTLVDDKIAFTQTDLNEFIDSFNDGYMDGAATTAHRFWNIQSATLTKILELDSSGATFNGNYAESVQMARHTTSNTAGNSLTVQGGGATSGATDKDGGMVVLQPGLSTGTGKGSIRMKRLTRAGSTGTSDNSLVDAHIIAAEVSMTSETTVNLFEVALPANSACGGWVTFQAIASDGTDFVVHSGHANYAATNKAGVYVTQIMDESAADDANASSKVGAAITDTWAITSGTNKITISLGIAVSNMTANNIKIYYAVHNGSRNAITQL